MKHISQQFVCPIIKHHAFFINASNEKIPYVRADFGGDFSLADIKEVAEWLLRVVQVIESDADFKKK